MKKYLYAVVCILVVACANQTERDAKVQDTITGKELNELAAKYSVGPPERPGWRPPRFVEAFPEDTVMVVPEGLTKEQFIEAVKNVKEKYNYDQEAKKFWAREDSIIAVVLAGKAIITYDSLRYRVTVCGKNRTVRELKPNEKAYPNFRDIKYLEE